MKRKVITGTDAEGNPDAVTVAEAAEWAVGEMQAVSAEHGPDTALVFIPEADGLPDRFTALKPDTPGLRAAVETLLADGWTPIGFLVFERQGGVVILKHVLFDMPEEAPPSALKVLEWVKGEYAEASHLREVKPS
jgi:hypothetical protein